MVVRSIDLEKDVFRPRGEGEEILGSEFLYLSLIGALMYLANSTSFDIAFAVNLFARHSAPTKCHWVRGKQILRYLNGTKDMSLFYQKNQDPTLVGYTDMAIYLIPIMPDRRHDSFSYMVEFSFLWNHLNKYWWQFP